MKNIFKKTAGVMLATSIMCAMLATGCNNKNTSVADKDSATEVATEATTEAVTEAVTEATTESTTESTTEATTEAVTSTKSDEIITIKQYQDYNAGDFGITAEVTDSSYKYLKVTSLADLKEEYEITDECMIDFLDIVVVSRVFTEDDTIEKVENTVLNETAKVSIPYQEGVYIVHTVDGVSYDVETEYVDGKYVFETDKLGSFMIRTEPVGRKTPEKTTDLELAQQTIVDEKTGLQVSGMLPVDAKMYVTLDLINNEEIYRTEYSFYAAEAGIVYTIEKDFPNVTALADYCFKYKFEDETKVEDIAQTIKKEGWAEEYGSAGGKIFANITFIKDLEILDFESDLTVSLPFDFREGLVIGEVKTEAVAVQYDYDNKGFYNRELVLQANTPKDMFQFKTKTPGCFFIGAQSEIEALMNFYERELLG